MRTKYAQLYKNYMVPEDNTLIGMEENSKKIKGLAEFSFNDKEAPQLSSILDNVVPVKKKQHKIVINNVRRNKRTKPGESPGLF